MDVTTIARRLRSLVPLAAALVLTGCSEMVLMDPKGPVGESQKSLIITATLLMLLVVIPVIIMTVVFAWKYRASNTKAEYLPDWHHSNKIEAVMWAIPIVIIVILGWITYKSTHELDPYKPLVSDVKPLEIQVVSLDWKWLFIYPEQNIATINEIAFPVGTPLNFRITSDSVMNAFFIPQLGSMIYSMAGMETKLHLNAFEIGSYFGVSGNYSGGGFSGMRFTAHATTPQDFEAWIQKAKASNTPMTPDVYAALAKPSQKNPVQLYSSAPVGMFDNIVHNQMTRIAGVDSATCTPTSNNLIAAAE